MPSEIIFDVMRYTAANDFMAQCKSMYPEYIYVMSGMQYVSVECRTAFYFAAIRKKFCKAWEISLNGPSIDVDDSEGTLTRPLDISDLGISLADFKLLNMLLSDKDHSSIKNLTAEKVDELDKWMVKLKLDTYRFLYIGRTRVGDETGNQVETIFYGRDRRAPAVRDEGVARYKVVAGFDEKFDLIYYENWNYYESLAVKLPENMTWITSHRASHAKPLVKNSSTSVFIW